MKLQPYHQSTVATRSCEKLTKRYYGPFYVLARVGHVAYKLALPSSSNIHPVFHIHFSNVSMVLILLLIISCHQLVWTINHYIGLLQFALLELCLNKGKMPLNSGIMAG